MKKTIFVLLCGATLGLSACGTINGMGRDMEAAGGAIQRTVN